MAEDYTVTGQGQAQAIGPTGALIDVWRVTFQTTETGTQATVDIPLDAWKADPTGTTSAAIGELIGPINATLAL